MSIIGAFVEIPTGHSEPDWSGWENFTSGRFNSKGSWGLDVDWNTAVPENAQVYLVWVPEVVAVWNDEEEIEDGEDRNDEDDTVAGLGDEEVASEPDEGGGSTGGDEVD